MEKRKRQPNLLRHWIVKILMALCVAGLARWLWGFYFASSRLAGPLWIFGVPLLLCPLSALVIGFAGLLLFCLVKASVQTKNMIPGILLIVGTFLIFQIPMPSGLSAGEKWHFLAHREDYEAVIELARQKQLEATNCGYGDGYRLPPELAHVSTDGCVKTGRYPKEIYFYPLETSYYYFLAYDSCPEYTDVDERIDNKWYICQADWG